MKKEKIKEPKPQKIKKPKPVKTSKTPKAPKTPKTPKTPKMPKKPKPTKANKVQGSKVVKEKGIAEVPFYKSISMKLIAGFMVPVIGILVLGIASYQKASNAVVTNYKNSVQQTVDMMQQYVTLVVTSEKDEFKNYLTDGDLKKYFGGLIDELNIGPTRKTYQSKLMNKMALDDKVAGVYFLADNRMTIDFHTAVNPRDMYTEYSKTEQGQQVINSSSTWFMYGQDAACDEVLEIDTSEYCLRLAKRFNDYQAVMLVNLDAKIVRTAMQSLDPGENGYVALVTVDGREFYSDEEVQRDTPLIYGTDFYAQAVDSNEGKGSQTVKVDGTEYLFVYNKLAAGDDTLVAALIPSERLLAQSAEIKQLSIILTIVSAIIALFLGILISRNMSGTIHYILRQLGKVSKGDLTIHLTTKRKDELGLLCDGVNNTVGQVKNLITSVNEVSEEVGQAAAYMAETSGTFMETSQNIQSAVSEIELGVNRLDSGSGDCLNQMDSLSGKINNVSSNAGEIERLTNAAGTTINSGITYVQGLTKSAESTAEITRNVIQSIEELENKSKSISNIISAINDIAEQTNLLSLNASIEAARAGEAGRGFAVVAEEIRKLSDQCLLSAGQITKIVDEIVSQTKDVVSIAREAESVVSSQSGAVEDTTSSFRQIDSQVEELIGALRIIASNVQEMNGARNQTLNAIENISAASTETAACSTSVYDAAGTQLKAVQDLDSASQQLAAKADSLLDILSTFQI